MFGNYQKSRVYGCSGFCDGTRLYWNRNVADIL